MTGISGIIIRTYSFLLRLYPGSFRRNFEEQMLLDFSDLAADASRRGKWGLTFFCLRELIDFPVNLLKICLEKESLNPVFRPGAGCNILRIALAFGLAFALNNFVGILAFARQSYFADFSRFAAAINWLGILQVESIVFSSSDLILGPVFVAVVLLIIFPEMRPVKRYLPGTALAFALPAILVDLWSSVLKSLDLPFKDTLFALASGLLAKFCNELIQAYC